jgi:cysteine desulfurase/selenocysteine lyase
MEAMDQFYKRSYATVHRGVYLHARRATDLYEGVRRKVKEFIHARSDEEIVFTRGTTASLNLVAHSFGSAFLKRGDTIMLSKMEHHSNIVPWQMLQERMGINIELIPINADGEVVLEQLEKKLTENVKLLSLAHISNVTGVIHPLKEIIDLAHKVGARLCVDGAQGCAHQPLDVQDLDVDFYAFSGHKMYGPTGVGVLYGKNELLEKMPPYEGGGDMIEKVSFEKTTYAPPPLRFEAGTPMIAEVLGLGRAIDYLQALRLEEIRAWEESLVDYALTRLQSIKGIKILGPLQKRGAIISFTIEGAHPLDVATLLDCKNIALRSGHHCSQPAMDHFGIFACLRISFALYNTPDEIDLFITALEQVVASLR